MKKVVSFSALLIFLLLVGCSIGTNGPSDAEIKEMVTAGVENSMDAFCTNPEVKSLEILKRGEPGEFRNTTNYPVRVKVEKECSSKGMLSGGDKTETKEYSFWRDEYDEWKFRSTSF